MYEAFYGLSEKPFNLTPDPKYLFLSEKHKEAFAHLLYGIKSGSGFVMVTGEIGTGKTTICRNLVQQLDDGTELAFIFNPALKPAELIKKILREFGLTPQGDDVLDLVEELNTYLLEAKSKGHNCVLLIDEAQNLSPQVLEQIRLLSNLETETEKLLQIVLVGQPELGEMLALHELRQLNQRITARYHLKELSEKETLQYVAYRLHAAGGRRSVRFNRAAVRLVYKRSGGTPRMINAICDRALLIGYTKEAHIITAAIVKQAANEIRGEKVTTGKRRKTEAPRWRWWPSPALIVAVVVAFFLFQQFGPALREVMDGLRVVRDVASLGVDITPPEDTGVPTADAKTTDSAVEPPSPVTEPETAEIAGRENTDNEAPLSDLVAAMDPEKACQAASRTLLRTWDVAPAEDALPRSGDEMEALASELGLDYERFSPALAQLVALDLPALIRLRVDEDGEASGERWVALVGADGEHLWLTTEDNNLVDASWVELLDLYTGDAVVLWRDQAPDAPVMMIGRSGPQVAALESELRSLGRLSTGANDSRYDSHTARAVSKLQAETGLIIDGIAGRQVRMVLSSWLPGSDAPTLRPAVSGEESETPPTSLAQVSPPPEPATAEITEDASKPPSEVVEPQETPASEPAEETPEAEEPADEGGEAPEAEETPPSEPSGTPTDASESNADAGEPAAPAVDAEEPQDEAEAPAQVEEQTPVTPDSSAADDGEGDEPEALVSIEDLDTPFFPAGLGPMDPGQLKESTEPAPDISALTDGEAQSEESGDGTTTREGN